MAYVVPTSPTKTTGSASACAVTLPAHVTGDLLVVFIQHNGTATYSSVTAGWTTETGGAVNSNHNCHVITKVAASGSETLTVTYSSSAPFYAYSLVVKGHHATPVIISGRVAHASGKSGNSAGGLNLGGYDNSLVFYFGATNGPTFQRFALDESNPLASDYRFDYASAHVAVRQMGTYSANNTAPVVAHHWDTTATATVWTLAVRDGGTGLLMPYVDMGMDEISWYGAFGSKIGTVTFGDPDDFAGVGVAINSITVDTAVTTPTTLSDTWGNASVLANATNYGGERIVGTYHTLDFPSMAVGGLLSLEWLPNQSNTVQFGPGGGGYLFGLKDVGGNWLLWKLGHPNITPSAVWQRVFLEIGSGTSLWAWSGASAAATLAAMDWTDIVGAAFLIDRATGTTATTSMNFKNLFYHHTPATISGGNATRPASLNELQLVASGYAMRELISLQGTRQMLTRIAVQIGDGGVIPTYFDASASALEFPESYVATAFSDKQKWRVAQDLIGISLYTGAADNINLSAGVANSNQEALLTVNASSSVSADYSFTGESFIGFLPTWATNVALSNVTIKGCDKFNAVGAPLTNVSISETTATDAAVGYTANGVMDSCTIDVTNTSASYHLELGTSVTAMTLTDVTFTGTPGADKVHVLKTTGTVTITISGTTALAAGDVTSAGATVVIAAPQPTIDATVLASSRVVLYNNTTNAELDNTAPAGTAWSKVITSGASIDDSLTLWVFKEGYEEFSTSFLYTGDDATILVSQVVDANLTSLRTELSISDYTTIAEYALDITGTVEIDADDADGDTQKARFAIWYNGVLTTENGARYLRGALSILSTAAFRINVNVLDLQFENISVTKGLNFTDTERRLYRSDGTPIYVPASAAGSIQNDYSGVPDTVNVSDQSLNLATAIQALDDQGYTPERAIKIDKTLSTGKFLALK